MRALVGRSLGSLAGFALEDVPRPEPGPGEVLIRVSSAGLGYVDGLTALGRYQVKPGLPFIPGGEISGVIEARGPEVHNVRRGDRVAAWSMRGGGLAEYCVVRLPELRNIPPGVGFDKAAGMVVNYPTALHALSGRANLCAGETLLVLGAGGGVGSAAIEIGAQLGARVIACASSAEKRAFAISLGAHDVLNTEPEGWRDALRALTGGGGVDVTFDPVGGDLFEPAFRSLSWRGRHLVVGFAGGGAQGIRSLPSNLALLKGAALVGVDVRQFVERQHYDSLEQWARLQDWAARNAISVPVGAMFPFEDAHKALAATMERDTIGKIVVRVGD